MASLVEKRQAVFRNQFKRTALCRFNTMGKCKKGLECTYAHSRAELQEVPDLKKTSLCKDWVDGACSLSADDCPFAHGEGDLKMTPMFKSTGLVYKNPNPKQPPTPLLLSEHCAGASLGMKHLQQGLVDTSTPREGRLLSEDVSTGDEMSPMSGSSSPLVWPHDMAPLSCAPSHEELYSAISSRGDGTVESRNVDFSVGNEIKLHSLISLPTGQETVRKPSANYAPPATAKQVLTATALVVSVEMLPHAIMRLVGSGAVTSTDVEHFLKGSLPQHYED